MPGLGVTDPANLLSQAHAELGLTHQLDQHHCVSPPPSNGGSAGYPVWYRREQLQKWNKGGPTDVLRASLYCWANQPHPFQQTGRTAQDEMATFVFNKGSTLYSKQHTSKHLDNLEITKKKAFIKAFRLRVQRSSLGCSPTRTRNGLDLEYPWAFGGRFIFQPTFVLPPPQPRTWCWTSIAQTATTARGKSRVSRGRS